MWLVQELEHNKCSINVNSLFNLECQDSYFGFSPAYKLYAADINFEYECSIGRQFWRNKYVLFNLVFIRLNLLD